MLQSASTSIKNGTNVNIYSQNLKNNQLWNIEYLGDGYYQVSSYLNDNMLLDVSGARGANGTNVQLWMKNGNNAQKWKILKNSNSTYSFISALGNYYLDVSEAKTKDGTNVQIYQGNGNNAQKFILTKIDLSIIDEGMYNIASNLDTNMYVGVNSGVAFNNVNVGLYNKSDSNGFKWYIKNIKENIYEVKSVLNQKYNLDVSEASKINGGNVQLWESNDNDAQKWIIIKLDDDTYRFTNVGSGKNLDVSGAKKTNGTNIQQWENNGNDAQKFKLIKTEASNDIQQILENGSYLFKSALNLNKTVRANSNVVLYDDQATNNEIISTEYIKDGFYVLKVNDKAITNKNGNVITEDYTGNDNQQWFIIKVDDYYTFISKTDGKAMDISEAKTANNTNIQTYTSTGHKAQKYQLLKVDTTKIEDGLYTIASNLDTNMFAGINNEVAANTINVGLYNKSDSNNQKWYIKNIKENIYEVRSAINQKYNLDV